MRQDKNDLTESNHQNSDKKGRFHGILINNSNFHGVRDCEELLLRFRTSEREVWIRVRWFMDTERSFGHNTGTGVDFAHQKSEI